MKRFSKVLIAIAGLTLTAGSADAHHSFSMFDSKKLETLVGTVKEFSWVNPHVILWVLAPGRDGKPETLWSLELTAPGNLTRIGWNKRTFKPGDKVEIEHRPLRSGEPGGAFIRATLTETGQKVTTAGDSGIKEAPPGN